MIILRLWVHCSFFLIFVVYLSVCQCICFLLFFLSFCLFVCYFFGLFNCSHIMFTSLKWSYTTVCCLGIGKGRLDSTGILKRNLYLFYSTSIWESFPLTFSLSDISEWLMIKYCFPLQWDVTLAIGNIVPCYWLSI